MKLSHCFGLSLLVCATASTCAKEETSLGEAQTQYGGGPHGVSSNSDPDIYKFFEWQGPQRGDERSPCPLLNAFANHNFIPHDGKGITEDIIVQSFHKVLNADANYAKNFFQLGLGTNPTPGAKDFSLDMLRRHNFLEHDGSLSRADYYTGNDWAFNQTIFDQTKSYWTSSEIDLQQAANARAARVATSKSSNPEFSLNSDATHGSFVESANYILTLGDRTSGTVPRNWVEYLFEEERLPVSLGWWPQHEVVTMDDLNGLVERIQEVTK